MIKMLRVTYYTILGIFVACEIFALILIDYINAKSAYSICFIGASCTIFWIYKVFTEESNNQEIYPFNITWGKKLYIGFMVYLVIQNYILFGMGLVPIQQNLFVRQFENTTIFFYFIGGFYLSAHRKNGKLMLLNGFIFAEGISMVMWAFTSLINTIQVT